MGLGSEPDSREKIVSTIGEIVKISDDWVKYLKRKQDANRTATTLTLGLTAGFLEMVLALMFMQFFNYAPRDLLDYLVVLIIVGCIVVIIMVSVTLYLIPGKRENHFSELLGLLEKVKSGGENQSILGNTLTLTDMMLTLLPEVKKRKRGDAFVYGLLAFLVAAVVSMNREIAVLAGIVVWLYFRWEITRDYEKEVARFKELKHSFEQQQEEFIKRL